MVDIRVLSIHLVSDSSGETISGIARACLAQFEHLALRQHDWFLIRTSGQTCRLIQGIRDDPGPVLYTVVDPDIRASLEHEFMSLDVPCIPVLDPVLNALSVYLGSPVHGKPGRQHVVDAHYLRRMDAIQFTIDHDDGQLLEGLSEADVIVFGVSRTSKTPMCMYLANRGLKAANIPVVPGVILPSDLFSIPGPLIVGLTRDPSVLADIRRHRLKMMGGDIGSVDYADEDRVRDEMSQARRLFTRHAIPVIDMTRKSIEEAAATVMQLYAQKRGSV